MANVTGYYLILSPITNKDVYDKYSIKLLDSDFNKGELKKESNIIPNRIFTADENIILYKIAILNKKK